MDRAEHCGAEVTMERCQGEEEWASDTSGFLSQSGLRYNSCVCVFWLSFLTSLLADVGLLYQAVFIAKEENIPHCVIGCLLAHGLFNAYFGKK